VLTFKLFERLELNGIDQINVIIGKNASGKTSLLQALALGLMPEHSPDWRASAIPLTEHTRLLLNSKAYDMNQRAEIKLKW